MLSFVIAPLLSARGIDAPFAYLRQVGFTHSIAHRMVNNPSMLRVGHINKLCTLLKCTPNDLFEYSPEGGEPLPEGHPLLALTKKKLHGNITAALRNFSQADLEKLWSVIDELKKD